MEPRAKASSSNVPTDSDRSGRDPTKSVYSKAATFLNEQILMPLLKWTCRCSTSPDKLLLHTPQFNVTLKEIAKEEMLGLTPAQEHKERGR